MPLLKEDCYKKERLNGSEYNMSPSGGFKHSQINGNLYHIIRSQLKRSVCSVSIENLDLHMPDGDYVIPDIMIICDRNKIHKDKYSGVPRFIVETLSPATAKNDRNAKKDKYASLGVDEYWIIGPKEKSVEIYYLEEGQYKLIENYILVDDEEDEQYNAKVVITLRALPNISMALGEIFEDID